MINDSKKSESYDGGESGSENCLTESSDHPSWMIWKKRRYVVAILSFLGLLNCYILRVNLSIGVVAMTENRTVEHEDGSVTYVRDFDWDSKMQGYLLSSFFYGYITTQLLGGWLSAKFGGKRVFGIGIGATAALTLLTPVIADLNFYLLMTLRIIEGIFEGVTYPCVQAIWARWAPPLERSKLASITFSGSFVGTVVAMPLCAYLSTELGWESIFYFSGALGLLWFVVWWIFITDMPSQDRFISNSELKYIQNSLGNEEHKDISHPWLSILTSAPALACMIGHFCENWGFYTMLTQLPTYMKDILDFELGQTGIMSALPYLAMALVLQGSGHLADYLRSHKILTTTQVRKIFNCGAFVSQTIFLVVAAYLSTPTGTTVCLTFAVGLGGFAWSGFGVNYLDIAPQHASVVMGIGNTFATLPGIVSPILSGYIVQTPNAAEWRIVFFIASGVYLVGAILYGIMASGELQPWAMESHSSKPNDLKNESKTTHVNPSFEND